MARLTAAERKALPKSDFGVPSKAPGPGSYPMPDKKHAILAKGRAETNASPAERKRIDAMANRKLHKSADGSVVSGADAEEAEMEREKAAKDESPAAKMVKASSGALIAAGIGAMVKQGTNPMYNMKMKPHKMADGGTVEEDFGKKLKKIPGEALKKVTKPVGDAASSVADAVESAPGKAVGAAKAAGKAFLKPRIHI